MSIVGRMLRENLFRPEGVPTFERKLFFEGERRRPYLEQFGVLLFLASLIATMGVLGDSTATVIGAMIVAPLMTPIMATAAALVTDVQQATGRPVVVELEVVSSQRQLAGGGDRQTGR